MKKQPAFVIVVGRPNCGKSWAVADILSRYHKLSGGRSHFVVFSNNFPQLPGKVEQLRPVLDVTRNQNKLAEIYLSRSNCAFVVDDCKQWIKSIHTESSVLSGIVSEQRLRNNDVFIIAHSWAQVPTWLIDRRPTLLIFNHTARGRSNFADKLDNPGKFLQLCDDVNQISSRRKKGSEYYFTSLQI